MLGRRAAANLRLGAADAAAPFAQTLSVQSVVAGTTNTPGQEFRIDGSQGTGNAAGGSIVFRVAPAGSSGTAQNALATALTIRSDRYIETFNGWAIGGDANLVFSYAGANRMAVGQVNGFRVGSTLSIGFSNSAEAYNAPDVTLYRDAANTLALRNGANAQTFNVYNTFTSSTNFERFRIFAQSGGNVIIGTEKGSGGGTARGLELQTDGATRITIPSSTGNIITASDALNIQRANGGGDFGQLIFGNTNAGSYGLITANYLRLRDRAATSGAFIEMIEQTAPAAPAANEVRIYAEDDGAGKTRLMARFATGAAVQIAIEP
jgi:hypothetical protein